MFLSLEGKWRVELSDGSRWEMTVPGSLDESQIGYEDAGANQWHPDAGPDNENTFDSGAPIATRLTRRFAYEGEARLTRVLETTPPDGKRVFLEVERARCLRLLVNGREVPDFAEPSISTPHVFEVTGLIGGRTELTLLSDNRYPGLPHDAIVYSSAATDETQTNWNGVLGYVRLRVEEPVFLQAVRVYPRGNALDVSVDISAGAPYQGTVILSSEALARQSAVAVDVPEGLHTVTVNGLALAEDIRRWDEYEGNLYTLQAALQGYGEKTVAFGVRTFGADGHGRLALNGRRVFIRGEANCAVFPETGHPPMTEAEWTQILEIYKSYGVNMMRFHSHCPPEAAFAAADRLGMLMQPELSHWNPKTAFEAEDAWRYYQAELRRVILTLANHPSFVMLTLGNELWTGALGLTRMDALLNAARELDDTRLYANGSNAFYGTQGCCANSDFYTAEAFYGDLLRGVSSGTGLTGGRLRGRINNHYPDGKGNYEDAMAKLRRTCRKPVFGFEVGQFEVLPDFDELADFKGVTDPANLRLIRDGVRANGLERVWKRYVAAAGELSRIGYREEVEAVLRTPSMSGLSLLGLQDFPGQGTALVGMLNSHLRPKPYDFARPERFAAFFRSQLPLACLEKYTYESTETLRSGIAVANYGKRPIEGPVRWVLEGQDISLSGALDDRDFPVGELTGAGTLEVSLDGISKPERLDLRLIVGDTQNVYPVWVYPPVAPGCPAGVYEARTFDDRARRILEEGGIVYLSPASTAQSLPNSIAAQFTTDFWSVGTFPCQSGSMGQLIEAAHPLFTSFPTEEYTNWQWWPMATQRAVILPRPMEAIIAEMDSCAYLRPMAQLFECRVGNGRVLFSSMGLQDLQAYPEARALLDAIYRYLVSDAFAPEQRLSEEELSALAR